MADPTPTTPPATVKARLHPAVVAMVLGSFLLSAAPALQSFYRRSAGPGPSPPAASAPSIVVGSPGGVRLHLDGSVDSVAWKVLGREFAEVPARADGPDCDVPADPSPRLAIATYLWSGKPGLAVAAIPGTSGPAPAPPPTPTPDPPDHGPVLSGPFWAVAVFDFGGLATLPAGQQAIFKDLHLRPSVNGLGGEFLKLDIRDPVEQAKRSMVAVKASGKLPALVLVRADGSVHGDVLDLPPDPQGVIDAIKAARGKR